MQLNLFIAGIYKHCRTVNPLNSGMFLSWYLKAFQGCGCRLSLNLMAELGSCGSFCTSLFLSAGNVPRFQSPPPPCTIINKAATKTPWQFDLCPLFHINFLGYMPSCSLSEKLLETRKPEEDKTTELFGAWVVWDDSSPAQVNFTLDHQLPWSTPWAAWLLLFVTHVYGELHFGGSQS